MFSPGCRVCGPWIRFLNRGVCHNVQGKCYFVYVFVRVSLSLSTVHEGSPLGELNRCVQYRLRVKVHIRSFKGLRGVCTGFVVAFDKFWNLVKRGKQINKSSYSFKALYRGVSDYIT